MTVEAASFWLGKGEFSDAKANWDTGKVLGNGDNFYIRDSKMTGTAYKRLMTLGATATIPKDNFLFVQAGSEEDPFVINGNGKTLTWKNQPLYVGYDYNGNYDAGLVLKGGTYNPKGVSLGKTKTGYLKLDGITMKSTSGDFNFNNGKVVSVNSTVTSQNVLNLAYQADGDITVEKESGDWTFVRMWMGRQAGTKARFYNRGGKLTMTGTGSDGMIGLGLVAGALENIFEVTGGTVDCSKGTAFEVGRAAAARLLVDGGDLKCQNLYVGNRASGAVTLSNGSIDVSAGQVSFALGAECPSTAECVLTLNGGTLCAKSLAYGSGAAPAMLYLDGGTLKPAHDGAVFIPASPNLAVKVRTGGAVFDTDGKSTTIQEALETESGVAGDLTVTGGGTATFTALGSIAGAFTVAENTTLHWFDQDGVVSNYTIAALNLAPNATLILNADATGCDTVTAEEMTVTATAEHPAIIKLVVSTMPGPGQSFPLIDVDAGEKIKVVAETLAGAPLNLAATYENGKISYSIFASDYTWRDGANGGDWTAEGVWTLDGAAATWSDNNTAVFANAGDSAMLTTDVTAVKLDFKAEGTVSAGGGTLTVPVVEVAAGVAATISAPTSDSLTKTGAGILTLGSSRTNETILSEGTLVMVSGASVDPAKLMLGSDSATPVVFDYGGQTLTGHPTAYLGIGMDVTLTNGMFTYGSAITLSGTTSPSILTVAKNATLQTSDRFNINPHDALTINVRGGTVKSTNNNNNWLMQASQTGRLYINVTDNGRLEFGGDAYLLTCRDGVYENPELHLNVTDSTVLVKNNKSFTLGYDSDNKNPTCPTGVFAATKSVISVGTGAIYIGHNVVGANTDGYYMADFENCIITAKNIKVYHDRPKNTVRFNGSTLVFTAADTWSVEAHSGFGAGSTPMTIGEDGLVIDTNGFVCYLQADPQGPGAITKIGSGNLDIKRNQTSSSPLVCEKGEVYVFDSLTINRAVTVKKGAKFTTKGVGQVSLASLALEEGAELRVDEYRSGVTPMKITNLTLPASGTVTLTKNNNFAQGKYRILEKAGITAADVEGKIVPATVDVNLEHSWSVEGDTLFLTVGTPMALTWTGLMGDGKMSTPGNWFGTVAPRAGDSVDFSSVDMAITVEADCDGTFDAVTMGRAVVTFTGALTAKSFSDTSKVAVGADAIVTLDGDLILGGDGDKYVVDKVNAGGQFIVTGKLVKPSGSTNALFPQNSDPGTGVLVVGSLVHDGKEGNIYAAFDNNATTQKWAIGPGGITGTVSTDDTYGVWVYSNNKVNPEFQPYTNDFTVSLWTCVRENAKSLTYNTTGLDGNGYTITMDGGLSDKGQFFIAGSGKVVVNHVTKAFGGKSAYSGPVTVNGSATLAINADKKLTSGSITMKAGTTLELAQSGTVKLSGALTCEEGVTLRFHFTERRTAPKLELAKTPQFGPAKIAVAGVRPTGAKHTILTWPADTVWPEGFDITHAFSLADHSPSYVTALAVEDNSLVLMTQPAGMRIVIR